MLCHADLPEMRRLLMAHHVIALQPGDPAGAREFATFEAGMHYVEETYLKVMSASQRLSELHHMLTDKIASLIFNSLPCPNHCS